MKKSILLTLLEPNDGLARALGQELSRMGLNVQAHFWTDDLKQLAFAPVITELRQDICSAWVIAGETASLNCPSIRKGLALAALAAQQAHGHAFPILLSPSTASKVPDLPMPLQSVEVVASGLGAKVVARVHAPQSAPAASYRLDVHALPGLGLWLEIGPVRDPWNGAFLGAYGGEADPTVSPDAHGVGLAGFLPERSTLHHPVRGMRLTLGECEYTAWGVQNLLSPAESYYTRLTAVPDALVFGPYPANDVEDVYSLALA